MLISHLGCRWCTKELLEKERLNQPKNLKMLDDRLDNILFGSWTDELKEVPTETVLASLIPKRVGTY